MWLVDPVFEILGRADVDISIRMEHSVGHQWYNLYVFIIVALEGRGSHAWGKFPMNPKRLKENKGKGRLGKGCLFLMALSPSWCNPKSSLSSPVSKPDPSIPAAAAGTPTLPPLPVGGTAWLGPWWLVGTWSIMYQEWRKEECCYSLPLTPMLCDGKHSIDMQTGPYVYISMKDRWKILVENFYLPNSVKCKKN